MSVLVSVCRLSVRPSVTRRYSVDIVEHILNFFTTRYSHTLLVFPHQTFWQYFDGVKCKGGMKNIAIVDQYLVIAQKRHSYSYYGMRIGNLPKLSNGIIFNDNE